MFLFYIVLCNYVPFRISILMWCLLVFLCFFFSSRRRHTRCALVTGVQTCALPISLDNFLMTMNISVFSFTAVARRAREMMPEGGSLLTLTYYGSEKVVPHYNVMGVATSALDTSVQYLAVDMGSENIRVNAISEGPTKELAAAGIGDFRHMLKW